MLKYVVNILTQSKRDDFYVMKMTLPNISGFACSIPADEKVDDEGTFLHHINIRPPEFHRFLILPLDVSKARKQPSTAETWCRFSVYSLLSPNRYPRLCVIAPPNFDGDDGLRLWILPTTVCSIFLPENPETEHKSGVSISIHLYHFRFTYPYVRYGARWNGTGMAATNVRCLCVLPATDFDTWKMVTNFWFRLRYNSYFSIQRQLQMDSFLPGYFDVGWRYLSGSRLIFVGCQIDVSPIPFLKF